MAFRKIDIENWERREFYEHFISQVVCSYSVSVNLDISHLKGQKLYPRYDLAADENRQRYARIPHFADGGGAWHL